MKKALSFLLALVLICCMAVPAFAADNRETVVSLEVDEALESYEVTIPPTITLDAKSFASGTKTPLNVTINKITAVWSKYITINCSSKNGTKLVNTENSSNQISYNLFCSNGYHQIPWSTPGKEAQYFSAKIEGLTLPYNTSNSNGGLIYGYLDENPEIGTYTDTLTFTIKFSTTDPNA